MRHFLFEEKEYRIKANFKRGREIRDPVYELARLFRRRPKTSAAGAFNRAQPSRDLRQRCTAKMQYSNSIHAHKVQLGYIAREGTSLDGSAAGLFGTDQADYENHMAGKNFRIFLSPESGKTNIRQLADEFVRKLEKQTGYRFYWQGACHYNTAHPHAHLLINGVDQEGREVRIPKDIVKTFMRETARAICTEQIGRRTRQDLDREREQGLAAPRYTKLDGRIQELAVNNRVVLKGAVYDKERILARLGALQKLKLCAYEQGGYTLKKSWEADLRANGRYNAYLKAREQLAYTAPSDMKVYSGEQGNVLGKVTRIYRPDGDASDSHVIALESLDGKAHFIPLLKKPEVFDKKNKTYLKEGEFVEIAAYKNQRGRLTPVIYKRGIAQIQKRIKENSYTGALASEVLNATGTAKYTRNLKQGNGKQHKKSQR